MADGWRHKFEYRRNMMKAESAKPQAATPPHVGIFQLLSGAHIAGAVACLAQLGIPDLVEHGPKSAEDIAAEIGAQPREVYRLMRATASVGVLAEGADGKFSETPMSATLRSNANPCLRSFAIMCGREWHGQGWSRLEHCVRTGKQATEQFGGEPIFKYLERHPEEGKIFNQTMSELSAIEGPAVADAYDFSGIKSVVDVAGGHGQLLATIMARNPEMKGTLYDLAHVVAGAKDGPLQPMMERCRVASGDMFTTVPGGADAYIMKHIIHDWPNEVCVQILKACRKGVNPGGKLLVVDHVILPGNDFAPGKFLDLQMLIFPGGCERTEKQFNEIFTAAGWKLNRVIPTLVPESIVEGIPA
jgi:O-methyltransferase domain/Dimerisation domain